MAQEISHVLFVEVGVLIELKFMGLEWNISLPLPFWGGEHSQVRPKGKILSSWFSVLVCPSLKWNENKHSPTLIMVDITCLTWSSFSETLAVVRWTGKDHSSGGPKRSDWGRSGQKQSEASQHSTPRSLHRQKQHFHCQEHSWTAPGAIQKARGVVPGCSNRTSPQKRTYFK